MNFSKRAQRLQEKRIKLHLPQRSTAGNCRKMFWQQQRFGLPSLPICIFRFFPKWCVCVTCKTTILPVPIPIQS